MDSELLVERTFCKVVLPEWIERIGFRPYFKMPPDFGVAGINQLPPNDPAIRHFLTRIHREHPTTSANGVEIPICHPLASFVRMPALGPSPEAAPNLKVHPPKRSFCHDMPVIICPTADNRVEQMYQGFLTSRFIVLDDSPNFLQERVSVLLRWLDEQFAIEFAEMLSEEIEPFVGVRDAGFLGRELKDPLVKKLLNEGTDFCFQPFLGGAGDNEVIRIPNQIHLGPDAFHVGETLL